MITKWNQRDFYRRLYYGWYQDITLLKRGDDQQQGTVTAYSLFMCLGKKVHHTGEPIHADEASNDTRNWLIPVEQLDMAGLNGKCINALDRIIDDEGRYWQPEGDTTITIQLGMCYLNIDTKRVDPPGA